MASIIAISILTGWLLMSPQTKETSEVHRGLPAPRLESEHSLESVLAQRRSIRDYTDDSLSLEDVSQLLWAAQGITGSDGERTAPSAGALYPLEVYIVVGRVATLDAGVYHYRPTHHDLRKHSGEDRQPRLARAALGQESVRDAAAVLVFTAVHSRTERKYGERTRRYVAMEAGHAAQNVCLQAAALGLGAVPVGAFEDEAVHEVLGLPADRDVLYLIPVGKPE
jgi:SagB-type dehydrogenase family enzyme